MSCEKQNYTKLRKQIGLKKVLVKQQTQYRMGTTTDMPFVDSYINKQIYVPRDECTDE